MQFAQLCDRVGAAPAPMGAVDHSALPGVWVNSNPETTGIERLEIFESDGSLSVRVFAIGPEGLVDWGTTAVDIFTGMPTSRVATGFTCQYDFGFAATHLQGMIMKGLLVLAQIHRFKDESGRVPFFVREYYALEHDRA